MNLKEQHIVALIKSKIHQKNPDADVRLFGSDARRTAIEDSDLDILFLLNTSGVSGKTEQEYHHEIFDIEPETNEPISTFICSKAIWESKLAMAAL